MASRAPSDRSGFGESGFLAGVEVVDAHQHFWQLDRFPYRWLAPKAPAARFGDKSEIRKDYLPKQYLAEMDMVPLSASVHVQANCGADDPVDETRWLQDLSAQDGWPMAVVAEVDLTEPGAIDLIDRHRLHPILRGIRTPVAWDEEGRWRIAARAGVLSEESFQEGARHLAEHGLCLDMVVVPEQMEEVAEFAGRHPYLKIVVNHFGTLEPSRPGGSECWRKGISAMAELQNISLKLSGLWTIDKDWTPSIVAPFVEQALNAFGSARIMYGSNSPVEGVNCPPARQFERLAIILARRSKEEIENIFNRTARTVYRVDPVSSPE